MTTSLKGNMSSSMGLSGKFAERHGNSALVGEEYTSQRFHENPSIRLQPVRKPRHQRDADKASMETALEKLKDDPMDLDTDAPTVVQQRQRHRHFRNLRQQGIERRLKKIAEREKWEAEQRARKQRERSAAAPAVEAKKKADENALHYKKYDKRAIWALKGCFIQHEATGDSDAALERRLVIVDRDANAAKNILHLGLLMLAAQKQHGGTGEPAASDWRPVWFRRSGGGE